ncbi:MAG: DUF1801 domain-containing protein [Candidatus Nomurabacteria bacterium]|nr:MAG: DUF1801 domain-containing protein [Candidatus Nomurabacteria bacterium]
MQSQAKTVDAYLKELPAERRAAIASVRNIIRKYLPKGYQEGMQYGMITYGVPLKLYPAGYLYDEKTPLPYISLASQKNHMALYHMGLYGDPKGKKWIEAEFRKAGKKLDMGGSCIRFKHLEDLPLEVIGQAVSRVSVQQMIDMHEKSRAKKKKFKK